MRVSILILGSLLLLFSTSLATTIHVPGQYPTIQDGINAAVNGDTVLVAAGTYAEHLNFSGKSIVVISEDGPETTIIERQSIGMSLVLFTSGESNQAILSGFTLQKSYQAPAIYVSGSQPQILNNCFLYNQTMVEGGAISAKNNAFPIIKGNLFWCNGGFRGGAIDVGELAPANAKIERNIFISNTSQTHGGAVFVRNSTASIINHNIFYMNYVLAMGAAICFSQCENIEFYNNTVAFSSNYETWNGSGLVVWVTNNCSVYNNIFVENIGIGMRQEPFYSSSFSYNNVWNNTVDYVNITPGNGSISDDPLFVGGDPYSFELTANSPCIDAGDPNSPLDPDGTIADMGALYYPQVTSVENQPVIPESWLLYQNYPNPFNSQTNIRFSIPDESSVKVDIFDTLGRKVRSLLDNQLQAGEHTINWDGRSGSGERMSSGVYFYNLKTDTFEDSKKMVILK
ncbi:MAG: T9SS type A sorting domain-containing protein [Candidatus Zixiibacteriota bacterium]|nr:MAG: T9SS type A sorting domain-containing protein [candidate division Zixibacteria bacterium]